MLRPALLFLVTLAACGGGTERRLASAETSVKAEMIRTSRSVFTDRGWRTVMADSIVVRRFSQVVIGTVCIPGEHEHPQLSLDQAARRVAYRCAPGEVWHVHYLKESDTRTFRLCKPVQDLDWENIPAFEEARRSFLDCGSAAAGDSRNSFREIFEESRKRGKAEDAARFLVSVADVNFSTPIGSDGDDWVRVHSELSGAARTAVDSQILLRFENSSDDLLAYRALLTLGSALFIGKEEALVRAGRYAARNTDASSNNFPLRWRTLDIALRTLARSRRADASAIACTAASSFAANGVSRILPRIQLALIADQKTPCNLDGVFDRSVCATSYACCASGFTCADGVRKPCDEKVLANLVRIELDRDPRNPWPPGSTSGDELLVAAAREQAGPAARSFLARIAHAPDCK